MPYKVYVADNFHYRDESETYLQGSYDSLELAIAVCKRIVDEFLASAYTPGMTADKLYETYSFFGEDPYIVDEGTQAVLFSAWTYARERCEEMGGPSRSGAGQT